MSNIFGLTRTIITVLGFAFTQTNSLTPTERIWIQENSEARRIEFNKTYLEFVAKVQQELKLKTEEEAYHLVKAYYRGELESKVADSIELIAIKNPRPIRPDIELEEITYLIDSRLIKAQFPYKEFEETFGIKYEDTWTTEHTKAISEILPAIEEFFSLEANGGKAVEVVNSEGKAI